MVWGDAGRKSVRADAAARRAGGLREAGFGRNNQIISVLVYKKQWGGSLDWPDLTVFGAVLGC